MFACMPGPLPAAVSTDIEMVRRATAAASRTAVAKCRSIGSSCTLVTRPPGRHSHQHERSVGAPHGQGFRRVVGAREIGTAAGLTSTRRAPEAAEGKGIDLRIYLSLCRAGRG